VLVVTSESQKYADQAQKKWRLPSLEILGDPSVSLARHLKEAKLLDVFISRPDPDVEPWTAGHPFMRTYTNGVAQPATLVVSKDKEVWFADAVVPSPSNGGGAVDRPLLGDVWQEVQRDRLGKQVGSSRPKKPRKQTLYATPLPFVLFGLFGGSIALVAFVLRVILRRLFQ
jgi:hypothetical protein